MLKNGYEWTLSPDSSYAYYVFSVIDNAYVNGDLALEGIGARPVLYLNSNVYYLRGAGTKTDPFQIGLGN